MGLGTTSTNPVVMPDPVKTITSNSAWYVTRLEVQPQYYSHILKEYEGGKLVTLYTNRAFVLHCSIDKKMDLGKISLKTILQRMFVISVDGHKVSYRLPKIKNLPSGASKDSTKDIELNQDEWDWKLTSREWVYSPDLNLYKTSVTISGRWSKWAYRGTNTVKKYQ